MSILEDFIKETGDAAKDLIKTEVKDLVNDAKSDSNEFMKETGDLIEEWLIKRAKGGYKDKDLKRLIEARKLEAEQKLNTEEIQARSKVESLTNKLIALITDGVIDALF
jgi:hypothetical protein